MRILMVGPASPSLLSALVSLGHTLTEDPADPEGYDVVHAFGAADPALFGALPAGPLVVTVDSTEAGRHRGVLPDAATRAAHLREARTCAAATRVVVASDALAWEVAQLFGVPVERIDTVPVGLDVERWRPSTRAVAAARLRFAGEGPLVVYAGRMVPEKGVFDLLAAATPLRNRHPGTGFVFAGEGGDGSARAELIAEASRLKLHRATTFPGHLEHETLAALFGAADAVVLPSRSPGSGTVAIEAAAVGAPLAVASIGALASFVEPGVSGLRFPVGDVDAIVEATSVLLGDPLLGQTLGARARLAVHERHSWPAVAARTVETYAFAIAEGPVEPRPVRAAPAGDVLAGEPAFAPLGTDAARFGADLAEQTARDAMAGDAAWKAGVEAARAAVRAEAERAAAARERAEREAAGRVASDALDVVLASTHRA